MRRNDLIKELRKIAKSEGGEMVLTEGGNHTLVRIGGRGAIAIPRHNEINEITARKIIEQAKGD